MKIKFANYCMKAIRLLLLNLSLLIISTNAYAQCSIASQSGNVSCIGGSNGYINITFINGGANPSYVWTPNIGIQNNGSISNIPSGFYTVFITP